MPDDVTTPPDFSPPGIRFDKTVTLGNLLTLVGGFIALCGAYVDYRINVDHLDSRQTITEAKIIEMHQQITEEAHARIEMTRALDRLTDALDRQKRQE